MFFLAIIGIMNHDKWDLMGLMDQLVKRAMATEPIQIQIQLQLQLQIHNYSYKYIITITGGESRQWQWNQPADGASQIHHSRQV